MHLQQAVTALSTLGIGHLLLPSGSEGAALAVADCGRMLGLWPHWRSENALWIDPGFFQRLAAGQQLEDWLDPGGDRLQLWPEEEFADPVAGLPRSIDPGRWIRRQAKGLFVIENRGDAWAASARLRVGFCIQRKVRVLAAAELAQRWGAQWLPAAGWEEHATLELGPGAAPRVGLAGVCRVRSGGSAWLPLRRFWADTALTALAPGSFEMVGGCAVLALGARPLELSLAATEARPLLLYLTEVDGGRAVLLARSCGWEAAGAGLSVRGDAHPGGIAPDDRGAATLTMRSASVGGEAGGRTLDWRQEVAAFTGRSAEVRALAGRIAERAG